MWVSPYLIGADMADYAAHSHMAQEFYLKLAADIYGLFSLRNFVLRHFWFKLV